MTLAGTRLASLLSARGAGADLGDGSRSAGRTGFGRLAGRAGLSTVSLVRAGICLVGAGRGGVAGGGRPALPA
jgi:hypothetical protein